MDEETKRRFVATMDLRFLEFMHDFKFQHPHDADEMDKWPISLFRDLFVAGGAMGLNVFLEVTREKEDRHVQQ